MKDFITNVLLSDEGSESSKSEDRSFFFFFLLFNFLHVCTHPFLILILFFAEKWLEIPEESNLVTDYVLKSINCLKRCQEVACSRAIEMQVKRKTWYDVKTAKQDFKENNLVYKF